LYNNNHQIQKMELPQDICKTVHLKHETEYPIMQEQLNSIHYTVNSYIIKKKIWKMGLYRHSYILMFIIEMERKFVTFMQDW
jgi:hypothetical protein